MIPAPTASPVPSVSVVMTTLARPQAARLAVQSILSNRQTRFELLVVDQNSDDATRLLLGSMLGDSRLRYLTLPDCGASMARNHGAAHARGQILAFTDDDCEVDVNWVAAIEQVFTSNPSPGLVLGQVLAGKHDTTAGFVPACVRPAERLTVAIEQRPGIDVMAACMAVDRRVWIDLGGFDEWIGPGTGQPAGEDYDLVVRALLRGHLVLESPAPIVIHHGFRNWTAGRRLVETYTHGTAMVLGLRLGRDPARLTRCLAALGWNFMRSGSAVIASTRTRRRTARVAAFAQGLAAGLRSSKACADDARSVQQF